MPKIGRRSGGIALLSALGSAFASCGGSNPAPPLPDRTVWDGTTWAAARRPYDLSFRELAVLTLPWGANAGPGPDVTRPRFLAIVNLEAASASHRRSLYFRGNRYYLVGEERELAFSNLRREFEALRDNPVLRPLRVEVVLRADYRTPMRDVVDVGSATRAPGALRDRVLFACGCADRDSNVDGRLDLDPVEAPDVSTAAALAVVWTGGDGPVLTASEHERRFPAGDSYAAGPGLEAANAHWRATLEDFRAAKAAGTAVVDLRVGPEVPWAYVTQTLGLLLAADLTVLRWDGGPPWRLSTPPFALKGPPPGMEEVRDMSPAVAIGIGVVLAGAIYALGALTSRRRRRRA